MPAAPEFRWLGRVAYPEALALQESLVAQRLRGEIGDVVLLLEHDPVYTIGRTKDRSSLAGEESLPHPVVEIGRGGQATFHGPGQLVGYPILDLKSYVQDLHRYLRALEEAILTYTNQWGIPAQRRDGLTGVWVKERKLASIGVGVRQWITLHGFGLNVCGSLAGYDAITPCGIAGVEMTSLEREGAAGLTVATAALEIQSHLKSAFLEMIV
jgi:lipoyl(octanoyl) transferase